MAQEVVNQPETKANTGRQVNIAVGHLQTYIALIVAQNKVAIVRKTVTELMGNAEAIIKRL